MAKAAARAKTPTAPAARVEASAEAKAPSKEPGATGTRPRGRPRREIDRDAVADAVGELFVEGGYEAVTIQATAERLSVSRATLYRTVPTKEALLGVLFERGTRELTEAAESIIELQEDPGERLRELIRLQVEAAVRMRRYMPVFFGGAGLPPDVFARWHRWSRRFEGLWVQTVAEAMNAGVLRRGDPLTTARLLLGMCIWVSRWYRPADKIETADIAEAAISLLDGPPTDA